MTQGIPAAGRIVTGSSDKTANLSSAEFPAELDLCREVESESGPSGVAGRLAEFDLWRLLQPKHGACFSALWLAELDL